MVTSLGGGVPRLKQHNAGIKSNVKSCSVAKEDDKRNVKPLKIWCKI